VKWSTPSVVAILVAVLTACGGDKNRTITPPPANPDLTVIGLDIKFDKTQYDVKAGSVKIAYTSRGQQTHTLVIEDANKKRIGVRLSIGPGESTGETIDLTPGTYAMYCDVPGHRQSMNARLVVS
jgi:plastocyanin